MADERTWAIDTGLPENTTIGTMDARDELRAYASRLKTDFERQKLSRAAGRHARCNHSLPAGPVDLITRGLCSAVYTILRLVMTGMQVLTLYVHARGSGQQLTACVLWWQGCGGRRIRKRGH